MKEIIPDWPHKSPLTKRCDVCKLYPQAAPNINEKERCKCRQKEEQPAPEELDAGESMHENYSGFYHEFDEQQIRDILESMESFAQASITAKEAAWEKRERELVEAIEAAMRIVDLWAPSYSEKEIQESHIGEIAALAMMRKTFEELLNRNQ